MLIKKFGFSKYLIRTSQADDYREITDERNNFFLSPALTGHADEPKVKASKGDSGRSSVALIRAWSRQPLRNDEVDVVLDEESNESRKIRHETLREPAFRSSVASRCSSPNFRKRCSIVRFKFSLSNVRSICRLRASITGSGRSSVASLRSVVEIRSDLFVMLISLTQGYHSIRMSSA